MFKPLVFLVIVLFSAPGWAVNKCSGADGKVVFQDAPCPDGSRKLNPTEPSVPKPSAVMSASDVARSFEAQMQQPEVQKRMQMSIEAQKSHARNGRVDATTCGGELPSQPSVGMSESQFLNCTRFAKEWDHLQVNEFETKFGVSRQYVYPHHAPVKFIYVDQGKVTAISR